ncbi:hypothetical protein [Micromonospora sp. LOL_024]|uniref:hypothetical protein n=1 Tax=Micromonospora sp. LOL_024 TaxID=3345412 RepID=UPI003A8932ED
MSIEVLVDRPAGTPMEQSETQVQLERDAVERTIGRRLVALMTLPIEVFGRRDSPGDQVLR